MIPGIDDHVTVAILSALLTFTVTRLVDRVRAKDELDQLARATALPLLAVARALESHSRMLNEALAADDEKLRAFYKFVVELVPTSDCDEFASQVKGNSKFRHDLLACLRHAVGSIIRAQSRYEEVRQVLEVSNALRAESEGISRLVVAARDDTRAALRDLRAVSPSDTRQGIDQVQREFR